MAGPLPQRRSKTKVEGHGGRYRGARPFQPGEAPASIALDATLRRAAARRAGSHQATSGKRQVTNADLCRKLRYRPCEQLIVFAVDASESMGSQGRQRMRAAKGAVLALLRVAYQHRHRVALVSFGGEHATVILPPTSSVNLAVQRLKNLPTGGATPMADGLHKSLKIIRSERRKAPGLRPLLLVISDGEANVPMCGNLPPLQELSRLAQQIRQEKVQSVFLDVAAGHEKSNDMKRLAGLMQANYRHVENLGARQILEAVRALEDQAVPVITR